MECCTPPIVSGEAAQSHRTSGSVSVYDIFGSRVGTRGGEYICCNTHEGIAKFLSWIPTLDADRSKIHIGIEGGGTERHALVRSLVSAYEHIYEINPLFTKQRRDYGTDGNKSD